MSPSPITRLRRLRETDAIRSMVRETTLAVSDLIYPIFVTHGRDRREPVAPMPGSYHLSLDKLLDEVDEVARTWHPRRHHLRAAGPQGYAGFRGLRQKRHHPRGHPRH